MFLKSGCIVITPLALQTSLRRLLGSSILMGVCVAAARVGPAAELDDRQFLAFWGRQAAASHDSEAAIEVCRKDIAVQTNSVYLPVLRSVLAWHELHAGRAEEGAAILTTLLSDRKDLMSSSANIMARRWLTRLDRERVRKALSAYYARHVAFPESLAPLLALPEDQRPPAVDRWNQPWRYHRALFKRLAGLSDQRYELRSVELDSESDLKAILAIPYETPADLAPLRVVSRFENQAAVEFQDHAAPPLKTVLTEGARSGRFCFVHLVVQSVLLSDGDRWHLVPLP